MKKLCAASLALALCLLLAACGGEETPPAELDLDSIAAALADSGQLREPLEPQDPELVAGQLSLYEDRIGAGEEDLADARFSMTLGVAADQFLLLKAADGTAADRLAAALAYYAGTVFQVHGLVFEEQMGDTAGFTVQCSKGGVRQDPDRSIVLELRDGVWRVVSEGY